MEKFVVINGINENMSNVLQLYNDVTLSTESNFAWLVYRQIIWFRPIIKPYCFYGFTTDLEFYNLYSLVTTQLL